MKRAILPTIAILAALLSGASAELLEFWEFNEGPGADFELVENTGSFGSVWNWPSMGSMETDGKGNMVIMGDAGSITRKLPKQGSASAQPDADRYVAPLGGSSIYFQRLDFAGWDMTDAKPGDLFVFKTIDANGNMVGSIQLKKLADGKTRVQMGASGSNYRGKTYGTKGGPLSCEIRFNFSKGSAEYYLDGTQLAQVPNLKQKSISTLLVITSGAWNRPDSWIKIDAMGIGTIGPANNPAPAKLTIVEQRTEMVSNTPTTNRLATFNVQAGDVVLATMSANKSIDRSGAFILFKGTAKPEEFVSEKMVGSGPATYAWHATAKRKGTLEVLLRKPGNLIGVAGLYHLRSSTGSIEQTACGRARGKKTTTATCTFPVPTSGICFEACSTYNAKGAAPNDSETQIDLADQASKRSVAHRPFDTQTTLSSTWESPPGDRATALLGIAFSCSTGTPAQAEAKFR